VGDGDVRWIWGPSSGGTTGLSHNVVSRDRLFSSEIMTTGTYDLDFSAGSFSYFCGLHRDMTGKVRVGLLGVTGIAASGTGASRVGPRHGVIWAQRGGDTGNRYDVRFRVGKGSWKLWKDDTRRTQADFGHNGNPVKLKRNRRYSLQARSQQGKGEGKRSDWSPKLKVKT
jgi:hypothetical protein